MRLYHCKAPVARASLDPCFASCIFWDTDTARDAETARDTQAALNTRQARDTEMDRKVDNEFTPENLYICMDHGPMVVDRVLVRDLVDTHIEYKHERDYIEVSYCRRCHLEQEDKKRSAASEDENDKGQEHQKEKEEPCRHLVQTVRGGNQYGSWSKCLDCGKVLNYQKHGATSNKGEKGSTFEKTVNDKRSDPKDTSKTTQASSGPMSSKTTTASASATVEEPTPRQVTYLRLLAHKLGIVVDIPNDRVEASQLITDLRAEVDSQGLWR